MCVFMFTLLQWKRVGQIYRDHQGPLRPLTSRSSMRVTPSVCGSSQPAIQTRYSNIDGAVPFFWLWSFIRSWTKSHENPLLNFNCSIKTVVSIEQLNSNAIHKINSSTQHDSVPVRICIEPIHICFTAFKKAFTSNIKMPHHVDMDCGYCEGKGYY